MHKRCVFAGLLAIFFLVLASPGYAGETTKGVGVGAGISNIYVTLELDLRIKSIPIEWVYKYYFTNGLPGGLETFLKIYAVEKKHIRWHILNPGIYLLLGTKPLVVKDVVEDRNMDITFGTGVDVMPLENLVISLSLRWFLPDFISAFAAGERAALDYATKNFDFDPDKPFEDIIYDNGRAAFRVAASRTKKIYTDALAHPQVQFTVTWYFF